MEATPNGINIPEPEPGPIERAERRAHRAWLLVLGGVCFWALVAALHCYFLHNKGYEQLNSSLLQTVTAFSHTLTNRYDWISKQASLVSLDPLLAEPSTFELVPKGSSQDARIQEHLHSLLLKTGCNIMLLLNDKQQVVHAIERHYPQTFVEASAQEPSPGTELGKDAEHPQSILPAIGTALSDPPIKFAYEYAETQSGYVHITSSGNLVSTVVMPLKKGNKITGALLLGEVLSDRILGECSQGMLDGVLAVVVNHEVVAAFDKRTARRPAPLLMTSLEDVLKDWKPANTSQKITLKPGDPGAVPQRLTVAGRCWSALSVELNGASHHPTGWALFLVDTSPVDEVLRYNMWFYLVAIGLFIPLAYLAAWKQQA